ncbi:hypothetical protein BFP77_11795 [Maribacter sp. 4U21]|nr:hypothetical protein BFP77_11795 [Maribacter sp. 4U21]
MLLYPSLHTVKPNFIRFKAEEQVCAIDRLNILENGALKEDCGAEILGWFKYKTACNLRAT